MSLLGHLGVVRRGAGAWSIPALVMSFLLLGFLLSLSASAALASPTYSDVPTSGPTHDAITYLSAAGVLSGYPDGSFRPEVLLSRAQAAKMLVKERGVTAEASSSRFSDVDSLYAPYVEAAAARNWISGLPDGSFHPYDLFSREQMASALVRSLGWEKDSKALSPAAIAATLSAFSDAASVEPSAQAFFALVIQRGLFRGDGNGRLDPQAGLSRAQFALVCYRGALSSLALVKGIRSGDHPDRTRVVLDLSAKPGSVTTNATEDGLLRVDVATAAVDGTGPSLAVSSKEVTYISTAQLSYRPPTVRARIKLGDSQGYDVFTLAPSEGRGYRVVIDVLRPPAPAPPTTAPLPGDTSNSGKGAQALEVARRYLGVPYSWGGESPAGFDCSGLAQYAYAQVGIALPRVAADQQKVGTPVSRDALQPGDLVFFGNPAHHVGIYAGNGTMINAPYTGAVVRYDPINRTDYSSACRVG